jgi:hypothetical protein
MPTLLADPSPKEKRKNHESYKRGETDILRVNYSRSALPAAFHEQTTVEACFQPLSTIKKAARWRFYFKGWAAALVSAELGE